MAKKQNAARRGGMTFGRLMLTACLVTLAILGVVVSALTYMLGFPSYMWSYPAAGGVLLLMLGYSYAWGPTK